MAGLASFGRLTAAGWRLLRADALIPREADEALPPGLQAAGRVLRVFAGPEARAGRPGERLAHALEHLGPVAIKLGQFLSTRSDIFGETFAMDLARLKDRLPPFPTAEARACVEEGLARPIESLFLEFGEAVAGASLAQAHDAVLLDGRRVAVKVLRPGVERRVAKDAETLRLAAKMVSGFRPARRLQPRAFAEEVIRSLQLELDLRFEAAGGAELGEVMVADGYMRAPAVVWDGVGRRVLTTEWAQGMPLSDPAALEQPGIDRPTVAVNLIRAFLAQALDHGVFHADLHEGNLFLSPPATLTAVDFGIVGRLGVPERRYMAQILYGLLTRDYRRVAEIHFEAGYVPAGQDRDAFAQALRAVGEPIFGRTVREVSMGRVLAQLFEITGLFDMSLRPELVLLQKTMATVEGVARRVDPDCDIWAAADPVVRRWVTREIGPAARVRDLTEDIRKALQGLARLADSPPPAQVVVEQAAPERGSRLLWFAVGAAVAGFAFLLGSLLA
ncbi:MAG TPA: 2-polyprenylphenol 6-hydroxylase [Caulobacteraceae bacterium]|nr:2-polyprenylphenol 6-hydroxylase [Caulobacteraceae bacterium]